MTIPLLDPHSAFRLDLRDLDRLIDHLRRQGFTVFGPRLSGGSVAYDEITRTADLPVGWEDEQSPAHHRLQPNRRGTVFGVLHGSQSVKQFMFPPTRTLWRGERKGGTFRLEPVVQRQKRAILGLRPCDLAAVLVQDRVFLGGAYKDPFYEMAREDSFLIVAQCTRAASTCFCTSMKTGPRAVDGFDLALTELHDLDGHRFVVEVGSDAGEAVVQALELLPANQKDLDACEFCTREAERQITRQLETKGLPELLYRNAEHPRWQDVGTRCFACTNCTQVCPTCFCHTTEDLCDLSGDQVQRTRVWDSCFTEEFSYIHGGSVRQSVASRYRQWMTHKLAAWHEQFGTSGCVGCGRCITWCPAGIDLTEEAAALRQTDLAAT